MFRKAYELILKLGVPVVVASGTSDEPEEIHCQPQTLYDKAKWPLIILGSLDENGKRVQTPPGSPGGRKLAIHAPGEDIHHIEKAVNEASNSGTSLDKSMVLPY
jgi:hypothetical protein